MKPFITVIVLVLVHLHAFAVAIGAVDERQGAFPVFSTASGGFAVTPDDDSQENREDIYFSSLLLNDDGTRPCWFQVKLPEAPLPAGFFSGRPVNMLPSMHLNIFSPPPEWLTC